MNDKITERPILFSSEMVRAILDGRKTETRRVTRFQPVGCEELVINMLKKTCPYGKPGDILYVREAFYVDVVCDGGFPFGSVRDVCYRADCDEVKCKAYKWQPSIHMPKRYSRIKLKIKEVRIEKLQEITEDDAVKEGIKPIDLGVVPSIDAREMFAALWQSLNKKRGFGWETNCYVWVIKFERIQ